MSRPNSILIATQLLGFNDPTIVDLTAAQGWDALAKQGRARTIYNNVLSNLCGYNRAEDIPGSLVLADGYGQCNTKGRLLMSLPRAPGLRCGVQGFTIQKAPLSGGVTEVLSPMLPSELLHSWGRTRSKVGRSRWKDSFSTRHLWKSFKRRSRACVARVPLANGLAHRSRGPAGDACIQRTVPAGVLVELRDRLQRIVTRHRMSAAVKAIRAERHFDRLVTHNLAGTTYAA